MKKDDLNYFKIPVIQVTQNGTAFYVGKMLAADMLSVYTVSPAEYDINIQKDLARKYLDEKEYFASLIEEDEKRIDNKNFQRKYDQKRIKEISDFLNRGEYSLFPNSIIVACEQNHDRDSAKRRFAEFQESTENSDFGCFLEESPKGNHTLYVPKNPGSLLIIDGQHRIVGIETANMFIRGEYELIVTFLIDVDRANLAKLFYTINYTQKSVNKSLLYHLSAEFSKDLDELRFLHECLKVLNEIESSPLFNRIKMLGRRSDSSEASSKQIISQAFLIDNLLPLISKRANGPKPRNVLRWYYENENYQVEIIRFLLNYFDAIRAIFPKDWQNPKLHMIGKTIGVGAFLKVLPNVYARLFNGKMAKKRDALKNVSTEDIKVVLNRSKAIDLSINGEYGKLSGSGAITKLKEEIIKRNNLGEDDASNITN